MSELKFKINSQDIIKDIKEQTDKIIKQVEDDLKKSVIMLGKGAKEHAEKIAKERLPSSLEKIYNQNLYMEQLSDNIVEVGIREEAFWIEQGRKSGFMDELLNTSKSGSSAKVSKDGKKYRIIPIEKDTSTKSAPTPSGDTVNELKGFLRKNNIRYSKTRGLALDESGSPRTGKIETFNIKDMRGKTKNSTESLSRNLQGISVYQNFNPKTQRVERNIMTFRVISEKSKEMGKWNHPGRGPENILEDVFKWIESTWETKILPELKSKYGSR